MNSIGLPRIVTLALAATLIFAAGAAQALPIALVGGAGDPENGGFIPVPPNDPQPFTAADIANLTDGDLATGYSFSSRPGQYSSNPDSTVGFSVQFDFDVSQYVSIERIDFTWTGNYYWDGSNFQNIRFGSDPAWVAGVLFVPNSPDALFTRTTSFIGGSTGFDSLDALLHGDVASFFVTTELGFSTQRTLELVTLDTFEISADVTGTLRSGGPASSVPEPGTLVLFGAALSFMALGRRRKMGTSPFSPT